MERRHLCASDGWCLKRDFRSMGWGWGAWRGQGWLFLLPWAIAWWPTASSGRRASAASTTPTSWPRPRELRLHRLERLAPCWLVRIEHCVSSACPAACPRPWARRSAGAASWCRSWPSPLSFSGSRSSRGLIWGAWHLPIILLGNYHNNSTGAPCRSTASRDVLHRRDSAAVTARLAAPQVRQPLDRRHLPRQP